MPYKWTFFARRIIYKPPFIVDVPMFSHMLIMYFPIVSHMSPYCPIFSIYVPICSNDCPMIFLCFPIFSHDFPMFSQYVHMYFPLFPIYVPIFSHVFQYFPMIFPLKQQGSSIPALFQWRGGEALGGEVAVGGWTSGGFLFSFFSDPGEP